MPDIAPLVGQESYRLLIESVKDYAILIMDTGGFINTWNHGAEQIKGYTAEEIMGKHFSLFYTAQDIESGIPNKLLQRAKTQSRVEDEGWRVRKDGSKFWANVVLTALRDESGNLIGYGKVTRDLSKRRRAEEEIRRLNQELEKQLQRSQSQVIDYKHALDESSIVAITDQKGVIKYVNDNFCKISKYSIEELLGQDHRIINSGFHSNDFIRNLWVTIAHGKIWRGEIRNKAKDGSYYWVDTTIVPFLNEDGKPYQYLAIRSDITQRKVAEEELVQSKSALEHKERERTLELTNAIEREKEMNEMKSKFVAMASHEFRTPLTAILSSSSLIEHYVNPDRSEKCHKHLSRIKSAVSDLTSLLDDFLSLERIEKGKVEVQCQDFDLPALIGDIIEEMDGMLKAKNQEVQFDFKGSSEVNLDKKILRNILINLYSNAIKYSPENKWVQVYACTNEREILISVKDEGIGIPPAAQQHLFSKFFRASNTGNIPGTGLGLNIVKSYVELMSGHIEFHSEENRGTQFTVRFPRSPKV